MEKQILELLEKKGAMKAGEIAVELDADKKEVDKSIKKLKAEGAIHSPKRCYYDVV